MLTWLRRLAGRGRATFLSLLGLMSLGLAVCPAAAPAAPSQAFVLSTTSSTASYNPTYLGNGYMGVRVPAAGQGRPRNRSARGRRQR